MLKKLTSRVMILFLVVFSVFIPMQAFGDNTSSAKSVTVHFKKPANWGEPNIYFYNVSTPKPPSWPGVKMNSDGNGWYSYTIPQTSTAAVLFNDGKLQIPAANEPGLDVSKEAWYQDGKLYNYNPSGPLPETTIYFEKPDDWTTASMWYDTSFSDKDWSAKALKLDAVPMESYRTGWYKAVIKNPEKIEFLFNGGDSNKVLDDSGKPFVTAKDIWIKKDGTISYRDPVGLSAAVTIPSPLNETINNLRIYEVMVSSFQDGDPNVGYGTGYGPSQFKGDLKGITKALTYIKSLGVNAIWLTPIFDSDGNTKLDSTGYFARDYFKVDPKFGTMQDAKDLVNKAHSLGLYVFLDGVFGHHKSDVKPSPTGKLPTGSDNPVSYPGSLPFYKEVATWWIDQLGIDGWRLDQCYQVSTVNQDKNYWEDIRKAVEEKCAQREAAGDKWGILGYMVGEDWNSPDLIQNQTYGPAEEPGLYSAFDFPVRYGLVQVLAAQETIGAKGTTYSAPASNLDTVLRTHELYSSDAHPNLMLDNHDLLRFGDLIQRNPALGYGQENPDYWKRHKAAISFLAAYTGPITLYYGDEIGDEVPDFVHTGDSGLYDDHSGRDDGQIINLDSKQLDMKNYVAKLMDIRTNNSALWNGKRTNLIANDTQFADLKKDGNNVMVYALNTSTKSSTFSFPDKNIGGIGLVDQITGEFIKPSNGQYSVLVDGLTPRFLKMVDTVPVPAPKITSIKINGPTSVKVGKKITFTAQVKYSNGTTKSESVAWSNSNKGIGILSLTNNTSNALKGIKVGKATITASKNGISTKVIISVVK